MSFFLKDLFLRLHCIEVGCKDKVNIYELVGVGGGNLYRTISPFSFLAWNSILFCSDFIGLVGKPVLPLSQDLELETWIGIPLPCVNAGRLPASLWLCLPGVRAASWGDGTDSTVGARVALRALPGSPDLYCVWPLVAVPLLSLPMRARPQPVPGVQQGHCNMEK